MKRIFTLLAAVALITATAGARQLTAAEALSRVSTSGMHKVKGQAPTPVYTATYNGINTIYIFSTPGEGYMVVSADDVATPLLGYADMGTFDPDSIPPQMKWWLGEYSRQISSASQQGGRPRLSSMLRSGAESRTPVAPITQTLWNQAAPYNDLCPVLTSSTGSSERAVTGCVATAMAQVMKTHNWPARGTGSNTYRFNYNGISYTETLNFGNTTFDWANMSDVYDASSTSTENDAVATLMYACGVSVNMSYGLASTGGSGAVSFNAAKALVTNFGYDKGLRYLEREYFDYNDWVDIIYNEVSAGRPVLFGGQSSEGGHEFVCDGYSTDDYFHFNWGWGGMSDGYFLLTALDPANQGIGGSNSGFNMSQDIIVGIQRPIEGSTIVPQMVLNGDFDPSESSYYVGQTMAFGASEETMFYSQSLSAIPCTLGIKLTDTATGDVQYIAAQNSSTQLPTQSGWFVMSVNSSTFPTGTFRVTPAFKSGAEWYDIRVSIDNISYVTAMCDGSQIYFSTPSTGDGFEVTSATQETPVYIGSPSEFTVTVSTTNEFYGEVIPVLIDSEQQGVVAQGIPKGLSYLSGESGTIDWVTNFSAVTRSNPLTAGQYYLAFISPSGESYSQLYPVTVNSQSGVEPEIEVNGISFADVSGSGTKADPYIVSPSMLSATVSLTGVQGYWAQNVVGGLFDPATGAEVTTFGAKFVGLEAGDSRTITLEGSAPSLMPDADYVFLPWGTTSGQLTRTFTYVRTSSSTAIDIPTTAASLIALTPEGIAVSADADIAIFNTSGQQVVATHAAEGSTIDISRLEKGVYLVCAAAANGGTVTLTFAK